MVTGLFEWNKRSLWNMSVAMLSTLISLPFSIPLRGISLTGASVSGVTLALTKKYQKKLSKVTKLTDILTSPTAVFEMVSKIDEEEFNVLQMLHLKTLNEFSDVDCKMGAENRNQFEKVYWKR